MSNDSEEPTERTETEARQGITQQGVRWVLIWGTAGALLALLLAGLLFS
jgi:hypothetical protein